MLAIPTSTGKPAAAYTSSHDPVFRRAGFYSHFETTRSRRVGASTLYTYPTATVEVVIKHGVSFDNLIGNAITATWGVPTSCGKCKDTYRAV